MRPRLVLFGDSITEQSFASGGWGAALAEHFARQVLDRAMEGAADGGADPAAVTVFFGANDATLPDQSQAHLNNKWPSAAVILITPPPIHEPARIRQPERTNEVVGTYAQACIAVAKELGHPVIDIWTLMQQFPDWQTSALSDGLHFTPSGNKILFDEVLKTLESVGFSQHSLRSDLPLFHEIDPKDPLKAFEI
ncbi:hypothetical protein ZWY2020_051255 [Hordeum vulgare]|nr:hypothetical protein ZWY2020_051255 [Hordeum vulgare]